MELTKLKIAALGTIALAVMASAAPTVAQEQEVILRLLPAHTDAMVENYNPNNPGPGAQQGPVEDRPGGEPEGQPGQPAHRAQSDRRAQEGEEQHLGAGAHGRLREQQPAVVCVDQGHRITSERVTSGSSPRTVSANFHRCVRGEPLDRSRRRT